MKNSSRSRRGSHLMEFVLTSVPALFLMLSVFEVAVMMWEYHTLASAAQMTARYAIGQSAANGTIGRTVTYLEQRASGLDPAQLNAKFKIGSNDPTSCTPVSNCASSSTAFPGSTVGADITVTLTYPVNNPLVMFWPGMNATSITGTLTLGATSLQRVLY